MFSYFCIKKRYRCNLKNKLLQYFIAFLKLKYSDTMQSYIAVGNFLNAISPTHTEVWINKKYISSVNLQWIKIKKNNTEQLCLTQKYCKVSGCMMNIMCINQRNVYWICIKLINQIWKEGNPFFLSNYGYQ